jgi:hypothetical protein
VPSANSPLQICALYSGYSSKIQHPTSRAISLQRSLEALVFRFLYKHYFPPLFINILMLIIVSNTA